MGPIAVRKLAVLALALALTTVLALSAGCGKQAPTEPPANGSDYAGALDTSYENALDVPGQLALGTLKLEGTADAVTEEQAGELLALWQALAGSALKGDTEREAVLRQIERTMTGPQIAATAAMRLTTEDVGAWAQSQGGRSFAGGGQRPGGGMRPGGGAQGLTEEQIAEMRQQFQNMSPEERATRRAQFSGGGRGQPGGGGAGSGAGEATSTGLTRAVISLLAERSGTRLAPPTRRRETPAETPTPPSVSAQATPTAAPPELTPTVEDASTPEVASLAKTPIPAPSPTPEPALYVVQAGDSLAAIARAYGVTVAAIAELNGLQDPDRIRTGQELVLPDPARAPASVSGSGRGRTSTDDTSTSETRAPALEWVPDTDPGPPFVVEVSANRATQDPLVAKSKTYKVTGIVRNHGDRTYAVSAIHVTFFDAEGFRGYINKYPLVPGAEWVWHGRTEANFGFLLLAPGEACPFSVEITAQDMASFLVHPDAVATERSSAPVEMSRVRVSRDDTSYVRITGTATNPNPFEVKDVTVVGTLIDGSGQIVSVGSTYVLQEDIAPGASVPFDLRIKAEPYARHELYAQAEREGQ